MIVSFFFSLLVSALAAIGLGPTPGEAHGGIFTGPPPVPSEAHGGIFTNPPPPADGVKKP